MSIIVHGLCGSQFHLGKISQARYETHYVPFKKYCREIVGKIDKMINHEEFLHTINSEREERWHHDDGKCCNAFVCASSHMRLYSIWTTNLCEKSLTWWGERRTWRLIKLIIMFRTSVDFCRLKFSNSSKSLSETFSYSNFAPSTRLCALVSIEWLFVIGSFKFAWNLTPFSHFQLCLFFSLLPHDPHQFRMSSLFCFLVLQCSYVARFFLCSLQNCKLDRCSVATVLFQWFFKPCYFSFSMFGCCNR